MSYGDYLNFKKTVHILKELDKLDSTLDSDIYTRFKSFNLQTTVFNDSVIFNKLALSNKPQVVFDMEKSINGCPQFDLCDSSSRANRRPLDATQSTCFPIMKAPGRSVPTYLKKPKERCATLLLRCKCISENCSCEYVL
jgi:hypothetical protein